MYEEFRYKVPAKYLKPGDLCFKVGAEKVPEHLLRMTKGPNNYPWFVFVHPDERAIKNNEVSGWMFNDVLTDHPVYSEGWEYPGDGTRRTKIYLMSEELDMP